MDEEKRGTGMLASTLKEVRSVTINTAINYVVIGYAFVLPVSRAGISLGTALLFILWLIEGNFKDKFHFLVRNKVVVALFAFVAFSAISLLWSSDHTIGLNSLRKYWYFLPILVFATSIRKEYLFRIMSAFLFGMLVSEILSYGIFFELWTLKHGSPADPTPFMNHLQYSMFLTLSSLLLLNRMFFETSWRWKSFYFIYFLTVTSNLFLNGGRTGHVAFAISIFVVGFVNIKNKFLAFLSMLILMVSIFYTAYHISPVFQSRFDAGTTEMTNLSNNEKNQYTGSFGVRLAIWKVGIAVAKDNPLLGTGIGDEMHATEEKLNDYDTSYESIRRLLQFNMHNAYVQYLVQLGIIGLLLYLLIFYEIIKLKIKDKELSNLRYIFVAVFCIASIMELMFAAQFSLAFFALFVGIFIGFSQVEEEEFFLKR